MRLLFSCLMTFSPTKKALVLTAAFLSHQASHAFFVKKGRSSVLDSIAGEARRQTYQSATRRQHALPRPRKPRRKRTNRHVPVPHFSILANFTSSASIEEWLKSPPISADDEKIKTAFAEWSSKEQSRFLAELGYHSESQAVVCFVKRYAKPNIAVYNAALSTLANLGCYQETNEIWLEMQERGILPSSGTLATMFRSASSVKEVLEIREKFLSCPKKLWTTEVFETAIRACATGSNVNSDDAWESIQQIRLWMEEAGVVATTPVYVAMFQACAYMEKVSSSVVLSLLDEVRRAVKENPHAVQWDDRLWGTILQAFSTAKDISGARNVLRLMNEEGFRPNCRHCTIFIKTLSTLRKDELAVQFLNQMSGLPCSVEDFEELETSPPDTITVLAILSAVAAKGNYNRANEVLQRMKAREYGDIPPSERAYNLVISSCQSPIRAKELVREMRLTRRHRTGVVAPSLQTYSRAITVCRRQGDLEIALSFLDGVKDDGFQPDVYVYSAVIWTAAEVGNYEIAKLVKEEINRTGVAPNIVTYNGLLSAYSVAGKYDELILTFEEIQSKTKATSTTFNILSRAARTITDATEKCAFLEGIYSRMTFQDKHVSMGGQLIENLVFALGSQGRIEDAKKAFESLEGPSDAPNLRAMLFACSNSNPPLWELALEYLHTSDIFFRSRPPAHVDTVALAYAMLACSKADRWEESLNLLQLYGSKETSIVAFNSLIAACGRCSRADVAMEVLNEMEAHGVEPDELSFRNAIIACNQAEHLQALSSRDKPTYSGRTERQQPMSFEWWECALSLLRRMNEGGLSPDMQSYSSVISACEAAGQWQRALGVLQGMEDKNRNLYCYNAAISACEKGGAWVEAVELYERMKERGGCLQPNFVTIGGVVQVSFPLAIVRRAS